MFPFLSFSLPLVLKSIKTHFKRSRDIYRDEWISFKSHISYYWWVSFIKQPTYSFSAVNYCNRDVFLIFLIQTSLLTTSKSEQNCCTVFLLHVTISPPAGVNPNSSIIKQSRRSHRWWGLLQAPVVFSCLTSPSPTFQPFNLWGSVSHTRHSYTP